MSDIPLICVLALRPVEANHPNFGAITLVEGEQYDLDEAEIVRLESLKDGAVVERVSVKQEGVQNAISD